MTKNNDSVAKNLLNWQNLLRKIEREPLVYCQSFPEVAERWNNWWHFKADRPLLIAEAPKTLDIRWDKAFDLLDQPTEWVQIRRTQIEQTHFAGESIPFARVDIGPVAMAAFMGSPLHFSQAQQTSWQDPIIESWENTALLSVQPENQWLNKVLLLMQKLTEDARGKYLVCFPDLTGAIDALANMRTPQQLCLDLYENREAVLKAANQAVNAWEAVFIQMYDIALSAGTGVTQWVSCWANSPFTVAACDFNALIGSEDFKKICMPSIKDQARRAGLCVFHLDGPDAARHAETLAEDPDITAVQFTPGAGTPSALAKLPMLRMLQQHKVPVFVECPLDQVKQLAQELDPGGLAIRVAGLKTPEQADEIVAWRDEVCTAGL